MPERIQKYLANCGVASRRACEELVLQGRVQVNGVVVRELPVLIEPDADDIRVDSRRVRPPNEAGLAGPKRKGKEPRFVYIILNKPIGVVCTNVAQTSGGETQLRAVDLLPPDFRRRVYPVGRLDAQSRGLLLLTDDGELTQKLTHPSFGVPKTYKIICDGEVTPETLERFKKGVFLADRETKTASRTAPALIKIVRRGREKSVLEVTIKEGRNRQLRRVLASLGHKVRDLKRVRLGPLKLQQLPESASRLLTPREVAELREAIQRRQGTKPFKGM